MAFTNKIESIRGVVNIRPAGPADAGRLRDLRLEALAGHPQAFSSDYATASQETLASWVERLARYEKGLNERMQVAEAGGGLVGMAGIFRDARPKIRHAATIFGVYVNPAWRGLQIGDRMVKANLEWAASHEVAFVRLAVITVNTSAINCYLRCGFTVYGVEPNSICYEGRYYDELLMGRRVEGKNEKK
jgi:RimJ/RimL family protein N-acetyltransferase